MAIDNNTDPHDNRSLLPAPQMGGMVAAWLTLALWDWQVHDVGTVDIGI